MTLLGAGAAQADCMVSDIAGDWMLYAQGSSSEGSRAFACPITIDATGNIANTTCKVAPKGTLPFTEGKVKLPTQLFCNFTATFKLDGVAHKVNAGSIENVHRASGTGVGSFTGGGICMFTLVKQEQPD